MAYAAVVSLKHTIDGLLDSSPISHVSSIRDNLKLAHLSCRCLQYALEKSNHRSSKWLDPLEGLIRDAAHKLEDVLEFHDGASQLKIDLEEVNQEIISFEQKAKEAGKQFLCSPQQDDDDDDDVSSNIDTSVEMVGRSSEFGEVQNYLRQRMRPDDMCFFSYVGEVGTGRSAIGKTFFEDQQQCFDCSAWVTLGDTKGEEFKEIAMRILDQVDNHKLVGDEEIRNCLFNTLEHRRYLIVLDDVRSVEVLDYLRSSFPDQSNGSLVLLTTALDEIVVSAQSLHTCRAHTDYAKTLRFCLHWAVFGRDAHISPQLREAEKKIQENCGGRRMLLAKTLLYLLKTDKTPEQWTKLAADKENPVFIVEDEISELCKIKTEVQSHKWDMDDERDVLAFEWLSSTWTDFSKIVANMKKAMHPERFFAKLQIISLWGMAGIGKSMWAKKLFQDKSILCHYDHHVWVTLGPKYEAKRILIDIMVQIYPSIHELHMKEDDKLVRDLCILLSNKRCLIVMDDLWSVEPLHHLKELFPGIKGRALVTTRLGEVAKRGEDDIFYEMRLLDEEESWCLFRQQVFADGFCPPELEKSGRKIAKRCEGLPLLLLKVADQLLKVDKDPQQWNDAASGKRSLVFIKAHDDISKILLPSYKNLPQHLKTCFLYMGIFCESYEISKSKLTSMLVAEGFLEPKLYGTKHHFVPEFLGDLAGKSVIMVQQWDTNFYVNRCRLHCVFWHMCNSVAEKKKFFHAMDSYANCSVENMKSQRRFCIRTSTLLGLKDVQNSMASVTSARSLLCVSPPHQYPVPISFGLRLMRVMDALPIRLYEFPVEVVKLIHLRYLTLTYNGKLPTSISKLGKLQHLIVSRYMNTKSFENSSPLPMEIWDMKELKHLQIMGGHLPDPKCGVGLPNLTTLLDVSAQSCTREVLEMIPNLKRLGIRIELAPDDEGTAFHYLNNISCLSGLESLKCAVVNPHFRREIVPPPAPTSMFPSSLKRLSLSGFGYPWEHMIIIGGLSDLEELKLKDYAFRGPRWDTNDDSDFKKLKFLSIEDTDLVHWELPICMELKHLSIKHCYKLRELPTFLRMGFRKIEIVDCNPLTVTWAEQMRRKIKPFRFEVHPIR
ncbi:putative late blight resistance protein homolog R1C-3 [Salvia miltiorrhiza]|uniref:putative late blight resistance protein homolog R1C-3 n=1 Tax=Salvia miltiorrhiza TaxID=226208 RepID=UPI0025AD0028|nr:putative late blight resistance protein homolog R1C-3 [Salvia miltiorrhiza]